MSNINPVACIQDDGRLAYQIPLDIKLNAAATFDNFVSTNNEHLIALLQSNEPFVYLWAKDSVGKSHLLQAACQQQAKAIYLPLSDFAQWQPDIFDGLEQYDLICLDDVENITGQAAWEEALFNLFNRVRDGQKKLRISAKVSATQLPVSLNDLSSRLTWGVSIQTHALADAEKIIALSSRAKQRGFNLSAEVASYLLKNCPRDMKSLFAILDRLDDASIQAQRRITIPFIKQHLEI